MSSCEKFWVISEYFSLRLLIQQRSRKLKLYKKQIDNSTNFDENTKNSWNFNKNQIFSQTKSTIQANFKNKLQTTKKLEKSSIFLEAVKQQDLNLSRNLKFCPTIWEIIFCCFGDCIEVILVRIQFPSVSPKILGSRKFCGISRSFRKFWICSPAKLHFQWLANHRILAGISWKVDGQKGQILKFLKAFTV